MECFYIYIFFRPWNGTPFYVGKGKCDRYKRHLRNKDHHKNPHFANIIKKSERLGLSLPVVVVNRGLDEQTAFEYEKIWIRTIGREIHGGTLINLTDGGEGPSGLVFTEESKKKLSAKSRGNQYAVGGSKDPEIRKHQKAAQSIASLKMWEDPEKRAHLVATRKKRFQSWIERKKQSARLKAAFSTPESAAKRSKVSKRMWAEMSPERKAEVFSQRQKISAAQWSNLTPQQREDRIIKIRASQQRRRARERELKS